MFYGTTYKHLGLLLVFSCCTMVNTAVLSFDYADRLYQRAQHHMRELEKTLRELETMPHNIKKRSTDVSEKCVDLIRMVQKMCHNENTGTAAKINNVTPKQSLNPKTSSTETVDDKDKVLEDLAFYRNVTLPDIILYKASAKRYKRNIKVDFELIHSSKIYLMQIRSLVYQKKFMESTQDLGDRFGKAQLKLSRVSVSLDASFCWNVHDSIERDEAQLLILSDENSLSSVKIKVDVCKYHQVWDKNGNLENGTESDQFALSQNFDLPQISILPEPGDTIFLERGKNPSFEIEMLLRPHVECYILYTLYDWQSNAYERDGIFVEQSQFNETGLAITKLSSDVEQKSKGSNLLLVDVLNSERNGISDSDEFDKDTHEKWQVKPVDARIRVTVNIGSRELSGRLHIAYQWREAHPDKRHVIRYLDTRRKIALRLPYKISEFPPNTAQIRATDTQCDKNDNGNGKKYSQNCTLDCYAWGMNIKSIFIIKSPYRFPVKTSSYVIKSTSAYVIQDVGPASEDVEGDYRCTVVFENGKTISKDLFLATSGFTNVTDFTMKDFGNSTSHLVCTVYGHPPLDISIATMDAEWRQERLDNKVGAVRSIETLDNLTTTLTLLICNDELQYPKRAYALCRASGNRGYSEMEIETSKFLDLYNPYIPKLIKENSTVVKGAKNNTTTIFCLVTSGGKPVDVMVAYGGQGSRFRIDQNPENVRSQQETDEGRTLLTLTVPTRSIERPTSWIYCGAENEFGEDWVEFYLPQYGVDR